MSRDVERRQYGDRPNEAASAGLAQPSVPGELYGALFGGYTIAHGIDIEGTGLGSFVNFGTIGLQDSGVYGGKAGFFFPGRGNWAGVEVEAFRTTPDVKSTTIGSTAGGLPIPIAGTRIPGAQLSVTTVALNAVARAKFLCRPETGPEDTTSVRSERRPLCALQPYAGVGFGVFFADLSSPFGSIESPVLGLNVLGGVRYYFTRQIALFGEYKYNRASFRVDNIEGTGAGIDGVYAVSHVVAGLSLHW